MVHMIFATAAILVAVLSVTMLERQRMGVSSETLTLAETPVTIWRSDNADGGPLVVVAHGYAGSRQMMQPISIALARSGFVVAAFDFYGHGRNSEPMSANVTSLEGTTEQLVTQTIAVSRAAAGLPGVTGPVSLVGHSMATDVVIRAAERLEGTAAVVAISMYSDAVTPEAPERLLIVSGAREDRLRKVALDRLRQLDPDAMESGTRAAAPTAQHFLDAELKRWGLTNEDLVLIGFSQGTMMALHCGLRREGTPAGILGYSGALAGSERLNEEMTSTPPILLIHGDSDEVLPPAFTLMACQGLAAAGAGAEFHFSPGLPHSIGPDGLELGARFLKAAFAGRYAR